MGETSESRMKAFEERLEEYKAEESPVFTDRSGSPPLRAAGRLKDLELDQARLSERLDNKDGQVEYLSEQIDNLTEFVLQMYKALDEAGLLMDEGAGIAKATKIGDLVRGWRDQRGGKGGGTRKKTRKRRTRKYSRKKRTRRKK